MADEKEKAIEKDQQTIVPDGAKKDDLSEQDLEKTTGGGRCSHTWYKV